MEKFGFHPSGYERVLFLLFTRLPWTISSVDTHAFRSDVQNSLLASDSILLGWLFSFRAFFQIHMYK